MNEIHYEPGKDYGPHQAINGDTGISWGNLCVIVGALSPWFQLDMAESYCIHSVKVFDRAFGDGNGKFVYASDYLMHSFTNLYNSFLFSVSFIKNDKK